MHDVIFRHAASDDAAALAPLLGELGYPISHDRLSIRLKNVLSDSRNAVFVAVAGDMIYGLAHVCVSDRLLSEPDAEILALVVSESVRRRGIATQLVQLCTQWVQSQDQNRVRVRCNTKRLEAHQFYARLGYRASKDQRVFERAMEASE